MTNAIERMLRPTGVLDSDPDRCCSKPPQISPTRRGLVHTYSHGDILPDAWNSCKIMRRASLRARKSVGMLLTKPRIRMGTAFFALVAATGVSGGCASAHPGNNTHQPHKPIPPRQVIVVAPVLNLSNSTEFDTLKVTDAVASEAVGFPGIGVVPVNLVLAALAERGTTRVESPAEAVELARRFGAQATLVTAVTEYRPYDPPVVGLIMQWYAVPDAPLSADGQTALRPDSNACETAAALSVIPTGPQTQLQRVFDAAHEEVRDEVKSFARRRDGHLSPYGWQRYIKSQELYVRYCCWSLIRSILAVEKSEWAVSAAEARL